MLYHMEVSPMQNVLAKLFVKKLGTQFWPRRSPLYGNAYRVQVFSSRRMMHRVNCKLSQSTISFSMGFKDQYVLESSFVRNIYGAT